MMLHACFIWGGSLEQGTEYRLWFQASWVQISNLLSSRVTWGTLLGSSQPQFPSSQGGCEARMPTPQCRAWPDSAISYVSPYKVV